MTIQDLLEHYWHKLQAAETPEEIELWEYYVNRLTYVLLEDLAS